MPPKKKPNQTKNSLQRSNSDQSDDDNAKPVSRERLEQIRRTVIAALAKDNRQLIAKILGKDGIKYGSVAQESMRAIWATLSEFIALVEQAETDDVREQPFYIETKIELLRMCSEQRGHWKIIPVEQYCPFTGKLEIIPCCVYGIRKSELQRFLAKQADDMSESLRQRMMRENNIVDDEPSESSDVDDNISEDNKSFVEISDDNDPVRAQDNDDDEFDSWDSTTMASLGLSTYASSPRNDISRSPPSLETIESESAPLQRPKTAETPKPSFSGRLIPSIKKETPRAPPRARAPSLDPRDELLKARARGLEAMIDREITVQRAHENRTAARWGNRANVTIQTNHLQPAKRLQRHTPPRPKRARTVKTTEIRKLTRALQSCLNEVKREQATLKQPNALQRSSSVPPKSTNKPSTSRR